MGDKSVDKENHQDFMSCVVLFVRFLVLLLFYLCVCVYVCERLIGNAKSISPIDVLHSVIGSDDDICR